MAMQAFYDYDEASEVLGWRPSTIRKYCDQGRIRYVVKRHQFSPNHRMRYRAIPAAEILRLQIYLVNRLRGSKEALAWPT